MLPSRRYPNLLIKEEANNPTGSFKARGMSMAVTMARHYGLKKLAAPSAGNAASALAAYAAAAQIEAHIFMPRDVPMANYLEGVAYGAHVTLVDGLISDCGRLVAEGAKREGWFDVSTLKEPFRVEGKKTMGYELVEQLGRGRTPAPDGCVEGCDSCWCGGRPVGHDQHADRGRGGGTHGGGSTPARPSAWTRAMTFSRISGSVSGRTP